MGVEYIFMNNNELRDTALDYFISFRKYNKKLKAVYISGNYFKTKSMRL